MAAPRLLALSLWAWPLQAQAQAQAQSDWANTSVGTQVLWSAASGSTDADLLVAERLDWGLSRRTRALVDSRLTLDLSGRPVPEYTRVRQLGLLHRHPAATLTLGRHPVPHGGPRLVDGVSALAHPTSRWDLGLWGGLAPDLYTTLPRLRPGGGPILAWKGSATQLSLVGEMLWAEGEVDRAAALAQVRLAADPTLEATGRLDVQLADADGRLGLADGTATVHWRPTDAVRTDALYNAYSSLRYLTTSDLDPSLQRFAQRIESLGLIEGISQDEPDPRVYQLLGLDLRLRHPRADVQPRAGLTTRYRTHPEPEGRYAKAGPSVGIAGARWDVQADSMVLLLDTGTRIDSGLTGLVEPTSDGRFTLDGSIRVLSPAHPDAGPGWYGDLFCDWLAPGQLVLVAGVSALVEPDFDYTDVGYGAFLQVTHRLRRKPR